MKTGLKFGWVDRYSLKEGKEILAVSVKPSHSVTMFLLYKKALEIERRSIMSGLREQTAENNMTS